MQTSYDLSVGVPAVVDESVFNAALSQIADAGRAIETILDGNDGVIIPRWFEGNLGFAKSLHFTHEGNGLTLSGEIRHTRLVDIELAGAEFGLLLTVVASAAGQVANRVHVTARWKAPEGRPLCRLSINPRVAGRDLRTFRDLTWGDVVVSPVE